MEGMAAQLCALPLQRCCLAKKGERAALPKKGNTLPGGDKL